MPHQYQNFCELERTYSALGYRVVTYRSDRHSNFPLQQAEENHEEPMELVVAANAPVDHSKEHEWLVLLYEIKS